MNFDDVRILVVGDMMIDHYVIGEVRRLSPEAPVPVVNVVEEKYTLGGCGNVIQSLLNFGCQVSAVFAVGNDNFGGRVYRRLSQNKVKIFCLACKKTTVKQRIVDKRTKTQLLRIDQEQIDKIRIPKTKKFQKFMNRNFDMIVISDYAKGVVSEELLDILQGRNIIVDPKPENIDLYDSVDMITPNKQEWQLICNSKSSVIGSISNVLVTKGSEGATLISNEFTEPIDILTQEVSVYNVSGAGDVVISVLAACMSKGMSVLDSSKAAIKCATQSVMFPYTSSVSRRVLCNSLGGD